MSETRESFRTEAVDLGSIPGVPDIYRDYVRDFDRVREFYSRDYRDPAPLAALSSGRGSDPSDRGELKNALREQSLAYGGGEAVLSNIDELCEGGCAVVTGQQIGLFCGPAYTVYKAATAMRLAEVLSTVSGKKHVPVFWMECEDHDNMEVGRVHVLDRAHQIWTGTLHERPYRRPAGEYLVDETVDGLMKVLERTLEGSRYLESTLDSLRQSYARGRSMSIAFAMMLSQILRGSGLVIVDPTDHRLKRLASPVYARAVADWKEINEAISESSDRLSSMGYTPQIEMKDGRVPFFIIRDGERLPLSHEGGRFTDLSGRNMTAADLRSLAENQPEVLSPNVSLRPIVQDHLLRTSVYVGGPGEIAYFAQLGRVYELFGLDMPSVFPRAQFTLIEPVVARALEKLGADVGDFAQDEDDLIYGVLRNAGALSGMVVLDGAEVQLSGLVDEFTASLEGLEPEMAGPLETYRKKTAYQFEKLREKLKAASARRHDTLLRQVRTARNHLFPLGKPQERVLNTCYHLAQFGEGFARAVLSCLEPFEFLHRAVWMSGDLPGTRTSGRS